MLDINNNKRTQEIKYSFLYTFLGSKAKHKRKLADDNETDDLADEDYDDMDDLNIDAGEYDLADEQQAENDVSEMETEMLDCVWERDVGLEVCCLGKLFFHWRFWNE